MKIQTLSTSATTPRWAGSYGDRSTLLSGGARLNAADFAADASGKKPVVAGTLVGKTFAEANWGPATATDEVFAYVWADVADALDNADVELYVRGEVRLNRLPVQPAAALLTATKQQFTYTQGQ